MFVSERLEDDSYDSYDDDEESPAVSENKHQGGASPAHTPLKAQENLMKEPTQTEDLLGLSDTYAEPSSNDLVPTQSSDSAQPSDNTTSRFECIEELDKLRQTNSRGELDRYVFACFR